MTNIVEHPRPCMPPSASASASTMDVDLSAYGMPGRIERLRIEQSSEENHYVVACLPFFTYGICFGDLVAVRGPEKLFDGVVTPCGLRTLRVAFANLDIGKRCHESLHRVVIQVALPHEWHGAGYLSVLIRGIEDQRRMLDSLSDFINDDSILWEVDPEPFEEVERQ